MSPNARGVLVGGMVAGLIGYAVAAVFIAIVNAVLGQSPFYTAAALGGVAFYGVHQPSEITVAVGPVLSYNGLHLLAFLGLGFVASWFAEIGEQYPALQYLLFVAFIVLAFHSFVAVLLVAQPALGWGVAWQLGFASALAAGSMWWYLLWAHPKLRAELHDMPWSE